MDNGTKVAIFGAGFIGRSMISEFLGAGCAVKVLDHNACPAELVSHVDWVTGDFRCESDLKRVLKGAETAVHLVSSTVPGDEGVNPVKELSDNIFSTLQFLESCEKMGVKRIVFASSASVYGYQEMTPISERAITDPISAHGIHKLTIEKYLLLYRFQRGLEIRIARLSNPYGPGQRIYGRQGFVALSVGCLHNNHPILLRDGGRPIRDFIYIDDLSRAVVRMALWANVPALLNIGSGEGHSILEVFSILEEIVGRRIPVVYGESRKVDIPTSVLDITLARKHLDFELRHSLRSGLVKTLRHHGIPALEGARGE